MIDPRASARLLALVRAGPFRLALAAEAVIEVARLPEGQKLRELEPIPLLRALGEPGSTGGEWAIAVQGKTLRAYRVDAVEGIRERGQAALYHLPTGVGVEPDSLFRGAFSLEGALALELRPETLEDLPPPNLKSPAPMRFTSEPAPKALIFTVAGRSLGFGLPQVLSVVAKPVTCPVPRAGAGICGVVEYGQTLYPVVDLGALHFGRPSTGELGVLVEQDGRSYLVLADAVRGVRNGFRPVAGAEPGWLEGEKGERALFVRLEG
ncbi:MAG: chemotaxis protein CheW [Deltaproteobacteria bacterium]|nr:chemotaxis protein CheW [Deltaproteobacteria bacterium]